MAFDYERVKERASQRESLAAELRAATDLDDVYDVLSRDPAWDHLRDNGRARLVRGSGPETRNGIMLVGEAPGAQEAAAGKPFVGASGAVLDQLMELAGIDRGLCFITNVLKYRPPGNRTPNVKEQMDAAPYLRAEWRLLRPAVVVAIGATAHNVLHGGAALGISLSLVAGQQRYLGNRNVPYFAMFHPAYGLRNASVRPLMEEHWENLGHFLRDAGLVAPQANDGCAECARRGELCDNCSAAEEATWD